MKLLNYWLGKLNRLQLLGHGQKPVRVLSNSGLEYVIVHVEYTDDAVIVRITEEE